MSTSVTYGSPLWRYSSLHHLWAPSYSLPNQACNDVVNEKVSSICRVRIGELDSNFECAYLGDSQLLMTDGADIYQPFGQIWLLNSFPRFSWTRRRYVPRLSTSVTYGSPLWRYSSLHHLWAPSYSLPNQACNDVVNEKVSSICRVRIGELDSNFECAYLGDSQLLIQRQRPTPLPLVREVNDHRGLAAGSRRPPHAQDAAPRLINTAAPARSDLSSIRPVASVSGRGLKKERARELKR
ncbi:unnamed protein product [Danaus chrysippus]|uniref:(African queen) hypothetical protein n=1 Tax=Danaus chrysippus TaxID=151541 RepID=A0A8J2R4T9_9NEOP|nr:unnamed protein product [Danaus chrysippus]